MKTVVLYQNTKLHDPEVRKIVDTCNDWGEITEKVPAYKAHLDLSMKGSDAFVSQYFEYYEPVAALKTSPSVDINDAFLAFQQDLQYEGVVDLVSRRLSASVGDIFKLVNEDDSVEYVMVNPYGFGKVEV